MVLVILGILAVVAIGTLGRSQALDTTGVYVASAIVLAVLAWLAWMTGALPFLDSAQRGSVARALAKQVGGKLAAEERPIWGGKTATTYIVGWDGPRCRFALEFDVSGISFRGETKVGRTAQAIVSVREGAFVAQGEGTALAERLLDEQVRAALDAIDRLKGGNGDLSLHFAGGAASIYKQQQLSARKTAEMVALGTPVLEKAVALIRSGDGSSPPADRRGNEWSA